MYYTLSTVVSKSYRLNGFFNFPFTLTSTIQFDSENIGVK